MGGEVAILITQAIQGMGGIGKTQLAVEFAYRYGRFFYSVHWIDAAQPDAIGAEVALCGAEMNLPYWPAEQPEQIRYTLRQWQSGGPRLVILDNLKDVGATREWLHRLGGGPLRLLLTARRSDWPAHLGLNPLRLDVFTPDESRAFLRRYLPETRAADADLAGLAERLGRLPLALELAGRYLERLPRLALADYLAGLVDIWNHRSMRGWREKMGNPTGHDLDLLSTFALSWERVTDETARRLLLLAGHCAPNQPIPCELLEQAAELDAETCDEALSVLTGLSLLKLDDPHAGPTIHPLLAEYARNQSPLRLRKNLISEPALPALAQALAIMARAANDQMNQTGSPSHFVPLLPHARLVAGVAEIEASEDVADLWGNLGYHLQRVADYAGARAAYERALAIGEAVFGPDHPNVAALVNNLGLVLKDLGDLAGARAAVERALAIDEAVFGPDHSKIAIRVNNLGSVLYALGDLAGARAACERALAIWREVYGEEHPQVATGHNNLGEVLRVLGDLAGARAAFERVLTVDEAVFGPDHPNVARDVNNLGSVLRDLGDLVGARAAFERALAVDEAVFGPDHPIVAILVNNLGNVLQDLGDLAGARAAFERALAIWREVYGEEHPQVATGHNNLGRVLQDLGDLAGARAAFERALHILERSQLLPDHPHIKDLQNKLESLGS